MKDPEIRDLVDLELEGPGWRRIDGPTSFSIAQEADLDAYRGDLNFARRAFAVALHPGRAAFDLQHVAETVMSRRVGQGQPDRSRGSVNGISALIYGYTNGVAEQRSYFLAHPTNAVIELQVTVGFRSNGAPEHDVDEEASRLLRSIRWRGATSPAPS